MVKRRFCKVSKSLKNIPMIVDRNYIVNQGEHSTLYLVTLYNVM